MSLLGELIQYLVPLKSIAKDMSIIRELYELQCQEQGIVRITQKSNDDVVFGNSNDPDPEPSMAEKLRLPTMKNWRTRSTEAANDEDS